MSCKRETIWVFIPTVTGNADTDAPNEIQVKEEETFLGRNPECGIQDLSLSRRQILASPVKGDDTKVSIKHAGKKPSFITPRSSPSRTIRLADGAEALMNIGDKLSLIEGKYTYILSKKRVTTPSRKMPPPLSSSSSQGRIARTPSEISELQDMIEYGQLLRESSQERLGGPGFKPDEEGNSEVARQLLTYFPDRDAEVIKTACKLCNDVMTAADMLLSKTDEEILGTYSDSAFSQVMSIVGDNVDSNTIKEALVLCNYDIERATNKILADNYEAEERKKTAEEAGGALGKLRELYPTVDESVLKEALEAAGGDATIAAEFISADASVPSPSKSPGDMEKKKPRIAEEDGGRIAGVSGCDKYPSRYPLPMHKAMFPDVPEALEARKVAQQHPPPPAIKASEDPEVSGEEMLFILKTDPAVSFLDNETLEEGLKATRYRSTDFAKLWIFGDEGEKARLEREAKLAELRGVLPGTDDKTIEEALSKHGGKVEDTINYLSGGGGSSDLEASRDYERFSLWPEDADKGMLEHMKSMFPGKNDFDILSALEAAGNDPEFASEYLIKGVKFANYDIHKTTVDYGIPAQSITKDLNKDRIERAISAPASGSNFATHCFMTMLRREQDFNKDYFVFYHSYSFSHIVYELNSVLASLAYNGMSKNFPPLPRLLLKPFADMPEMSMLIERFKSMVEKDHNEKYRKLAICASTSLFATTSEAPPTTVFTQGYSCTDLNFRSLISACLESCKIPAARIGPMIDAILRVSAKYGLDVRHYGKGVQKQGMNFSKAGFGHMLQIFVRKDYVDEVAYSSLPYGVPTGKLLSECLERGDVNGQARIFMNPELFTDITKTRIFYYCPNEKFYYQRKQFVNELRDVFKEVFDDINMAHEAKIGIKGL